MSIDRPTEKTAGATDSYGDSLDDARLSLMPPRLLADLRTSTSATSTLPVVLLSRDTMDRTEGRGVPPADLVIAGVAARTDIAGARARGLPLPGDRPIVLPLPAPDAGGDRGRDGGTERTIRSRYANLRLDASSGLPVGGEINSPRFGKMEFSAKREPGTGKINELNLKVPGMELKLEKAGDSWKVSTVAGTADPAKIGALLGRLGIAADKDGKFKGELEITKRGSLNYRDQDGPQRKSFYLRPDGATTAYDHRTYLRQDVNPKGEKQPARGWDGREWRQVKDVQTSTHEGTSRTKMTFVADGGKPLRTAKMERIVGGPEGADKATFTRFDARAPRGEGATRTYDWNARTRSDVTERGGRPVTGAPHHYDGSSYRPGRALPGGRGVELTDGGRSAERPSRSEKHAGGGTTYSARDYKLTKDSHDRTTRIVFPGKGEINIGRDPHGDINRVRLPDGRTFRRAGEETVPGLADKIARGDTPLTALSTAKDFNSWVEIGADGRAKPGVAKFNIGIGPDGKMSVVHAPKDLPLMSSALPIAKVEGIDPARLGRMEKLPKLIDPDSPTDSRSTPVRPTPVRPTPVRPVGPRVRV